MRCVGLRFVLAAIGLSIFCILVVFVTSNSRDDIHEKLSQPTKCDCPLTKDAPSIVPVLSSTVVKPKSCVEVQNTSAVKRAIVIFYPHHQSEYFFPEVRWLYRSWYEMLRSQPLTWRTDFVIFTYNFSTEFRSLGCVNRIRQNAEEPSMCRLFLYVPIQFRTSEMIKNNFQNVFNDAKRVMASYKDMKDPFIGIPIVADTDTFHAKRSQSLYDDLRSYGYVDSINTIYEGYPVFKIYDFILRTDIDVFIYRHFANYIPKNCTLITGGGGYGTDFNRRKLRRIAHDMGFAHANISGMGSTWYGSPYDGYLVANNTLEGMLWLAQNEFATPERESKLGTLMWPEWHYGVLLLYGQHLALNHLVATNQIRIVIGHNLLDQSTTDKSTDYVQKGTLLNLHCWHTDERFSKFAFKMGHYNQTDLQKFKNDTTAQAYAMRMALESKYMTLEELAANVRNISKVS
ncbi:unnamed protein product [Adineta steineri]|uniref:DUF7164 domain-containing protein n=1 Tax=Adineta steineri TaxID=433720 RepID=A0A815PSM7_9BILA|nr:unnamed protein product [Adineta steineri]CAF1452785.1 unnamed protein product [Adineta steineri]CAF1631051.1 unnamed protein product [Adineta steineri]